MRKKAASTAGSTMAAASTTAGIVGADITMAGTSHAALTAITGPMASTPIRAIAPTAMRRLSLSRPLRDRLDPRARWDIPPGQAQGLEKASPLVSALADPSERPADRRAFLLRRSAARRPGA